MRATVSATSVPIAEKTSPAPSADVNLTYALGILVFILTNAAGIRARGLKGYFAHFFRKPVAMFPLHILEELVKPLTLDERAGRGCRRDAL